MAEGGGRKRFCILFLIVILSELSSSSSSSSSSSNSNSNSSSVYPHSKVEFLPGFHGRLPFSLETGYIGVDEEEQIQLFYYFIESENNPKDDPIIIWLCGGPGCSSATALFYESGPIEFEAVKYNGSLPKLVLRPYSWTTVASFIFIDLPVRIGFSYSKTPRFSHTGDFKTSRNVNEFLRKWLIDHPQFQSNPLYICGNSYAGTTVPFFFYEMLRANENGDKPFLNLQGYALGNPITDSDYDRNYEIPNAYGLGILSYELFEGLRKSCDGKYFEADPNNIECQRNLEAYNKLKVGLESSNVLLPYCGQPKLGYDSLEEGDNIIRLPGGVDNICAASNKELIPYWMNDESVQKALHVRKGTISTGEWIRCNRAQLNYYAFDVKSSIKYHAKLSDLGYRSLIYSGDHDLGTPFLSTQAWIRTLNFSIVDDWRQWLVDDQIAGYTRTYSNKMTKMTYATVKGGSHDAAQSNPKECFNMFKRVSSKKKKKKKKHVQEVAL